MARYQITISDEQLHGLLQGDRGLADLLEAVLNQVLQAQATEYVKAEPYERTEERVGYRNGTRERPITTRVGRLTLEVPQFRNGKLPIDMFERYQRSEQALIVTLMEMAVNGVSTRKIKNITRELCGAEFSKSTVSDLLKGLDPVVHEWIDRPIGTYPFLIVDAIVIKIRKGGRVRTHSMLMATGVNPEGIREILGLWLADSEKETSWRDFFKWLPKFDNRRSDGQLRRIACSRSSRERASVALSKLRLAEVPESTAQRDSVSVIRCGFFFSRRACGNSWFVLCSPL